MIVAIPVRSDSGDFFLTVLAQDDQRIFRIVFSRGRRSVSIGRLNLSERSNVQVSLTKPGGTALLHAVPLARQAGVRARKQGRRRHAIVVVRAREAREKEGS